MKEKRNDEMTVSRIPCIIVFATIRQRQVNINAIIVTPAYQASATRHWPSEGYSRDWPEDMVMDVETKKKVDGKWGRYFPS